MAANVNIVINAKDKAGGVIRGIGSMLSNMVSVALGIQLSQIFSKIAQSIRDAGVAAVEATANWQMMEIGLQTLLAREAMVTGQANGMAEALALTGQAATDMMNVLADIAILSPYQIENVQNTYRQAMAFGFTADEAMLFTEALLEVAAGVGAGNEQMNRMAYNLAQVRLQGKVTKLDIRQLALAGFDLLGMLKYVGDQMGVNIKTHEDFNDALAAGTISWDDFTTYFHQYAKTQFEGASERMARSLFGLKNTFHDVWAIAMPQIFGPAAELITEQLGRLLDKFIELRESGQFEIWGEKVRQVYIDKIEPTFIALIDFLTGVGTKEDVFKTLFGDETLAKFQKIATVVDKVKGFLLEVVQLLQTGKAFDLPYPNFYSDILEFMTVQTPAELFEEYIKAPLREAIDLFYRLGYEAQAAFNRIKLKGQEVFEIVKTWFMEEVWNHEAIANLRIAFLNLYTFFKENGEKLWEFLVHHFTESALAIIELGGVIGTWLTEKFAEFATWINENDELILNFLHAVSDFWTETFLPALKEFWLDAEPILDEIWLGILDLGQSIMEFSTGEWEEGWTSLKDVAVHVLTALGLGIIAVSQRTLEEMNLEHYSSWDELVRGWEQVGVLWRLIWNEWMTELKKTWTLAWEGFKTDAQTGWENLKTFFAGLWDDLYGVGENIVKGLRNGFTDRWMEFVLWVEEAVMDLVGVYNKLLGNESPSKVFAKIGENMALGLHQGFATTMARNNFGIPSTYGSGSGGAGAVLVYAPQISFATEEEAQQRLMPWVERAIRQSRNNQHG